MTSEETGGAPSRGSRGGGVILTLLGVVALVVALVVASVGFPPLQGVATSSSSSSSSHSSSSISSFSPSTSSISSTGPLTLCSPLTPGEVLSNAKASTGPTPVTPGYDEQLLLGFEQNFTSSIDYNVTVRAQNDSFGFGPAYLLNGLTDSGYWYQVGVAWNLPTGSGSEFVQGFRFVYEVWNTSSNAAIYPRTGGTIVTRFAAHDGDVVQLGLGLTNLGQVSMSAFDWNTSSRGAASYNSFGASQFLGFKSKVTGFPTSLLTEWYHGLPYFCSDEPVVYSSSLALASAWLRIDEWNLTGVSASQRFNSSDMMQCCIFSTGYQGVGFQEPGTFHSLSTNGTAIYANAHKFITP